MLVRSFLKNVQCFLLASLKCTNWNMYMIHSRSYSFLYHPNDCIPCNMWLLIYHSKFYTHTYHNVCKAMNRFRGVTRLDGARSKNQVWCPHFRTWGLSKVNVLYWKKHLWHCWDFLEPPQSFGAPVVIRRPGMVSPLPPPSLQILNHSIFTTKKAFQHHAQAAIDISAIS